jgi:hypothetical protein
MSPPSLKENWFSTSEKAVYGMMKSALLFFHKLVANLLSIGFEINTYDPCVANKIIMENSSLFAGMSMTFSSAMLILQSSLTSLLGLPTNTIQLTRN